MEIMTRAVKNSGTVLLGESFSRLLIIVSFFLITRYLGVEKFGQYSFIFAYLAFFCLVGDFGIDSIAIREISRGKTPANILLGNIIFIRLSLSLLGILSSCILIHIFNYPAQVKTLVYLASFSILFSYRYNSFRTIFEIPFQIKLRMFYPILFKILSEGLFLAFTILIVQSNRGLIGIILARILTPLPGSLLLIILSLRFLKPRFKIDLSLCLEIIRYALPLALTLFIGIILGRLDILILSQLGNDLEIGYYSAAVRLVEIFSIFPVTLLITVYPLMTGYFPEAPEKMREIYETTFKYLFSFILPLTAIMIFYRREIISFIFGGDYLPSSGVLPYVMGAMVFIFFNMVYNYILIAANLQRYYLYAILLAAFLNVSFNIALIPPLGFVGAGMAAMFSQMSIFFYALSISKTRTYALSASKAGFIPFLASSALGLYLIFLPHSSLPFLFSLPLPYILVTYLLGGITAREIGILKNLFGELKLKK
jgi:O-antigen/teichoic acid export membrane protein